jgi:galactose-1-phosphate uridylyltransferase
MNELRRDPMSGRWTIFEHPDKPDIEALLQPEASRPKRESPRNCSFCEGNENSTPVEICSIRKKGSASNGIGWEIRVVADQDPVMSYEGSLNERRPRNIDRTPQAFYAPERLQPQSHKKSLGGSATENN